MYRTLFRIQRGTIYLLAACVVLDVVLVLLFSGYLQTQWHHMNSAPCADSTTLTVTTQVCQSYVSRFFGSPIEKFLARNSLLILGTAFGITLGVSAVARELSAGTVKLAWSTSITRREWLCKKALLNLTLLLVLLIPVALANIGFILASDPERGKSVSASAINMLRAWGFYGFGLGVLAMMLTFVFGLLVKSPGRTAFVAALVLVLITLVGYPSLTTIATTHRMEVAAQTFSPDVNSGNNAAPKSPPLGSIEVNTRLEPRKKWGPLSEKESVAMMSAQMACQAHVKGIDSWNICIDRLKLHYVQTYIDPKDFVMWQARGLFLCWLASLALFILVYRLVARVRA